MSTTIVVRRPARRPGPQPPTGHFVLVAPPELPETTSAGGFSAAWTYVPMVAGAGAMAFMFLGAGATPRTTIAAGMYVLSMVGMVLVQVGRSGRERRRKIDAERRDYARYLSQERRRVRRAALEQRHAVTWNNPDPADLWSVALSTRLWERRPTDGDFGAVRVALGVHRLALALVRAETKPVEDLEPVSAGALQRFLRAHSTVPALPLAVSVRSVYRLHVDGDQEAAQDLVRALLAQLVTWHSPEDLRVAVCCPASRIGVWDWTKWLPHVLHPTRADASGPLRLWAPSLAEVEEFIDGLKDRPRFSETHSSRATPHYVVILDGGRAGHDSQLASAGVDGITVIQVRSAAPRRIDRGVLRLTATPDRLMITRRDERGNERTQPYGVPDRLSEAQADALARVMAPFRMGTVVESEDALERDLGLADLFGLADPGRIDPAVGWRSRPARDRLRVPVGVGPSGEPVDLDIKEAAQDGMGPHGLVIGATGSGKSELLRTHVLGLALTHSPEVLNFVLVDFKGGATFARLEDLPHTSAVITNLADDLSMVDRMRDAIEGELNRRQELLRERGGYANLKDYERARERGAPLDPLPSLFIVVDEFSELLTAKPDFIELFIMIGRIGRSLGVHLLLASQRLEEGRLRGLDTYLSYRIGLRTFSAAESRVVLGVTDAYQLPNEPGHGYLKTDATTMIRFRAAYVSGPYNPPGPVSIAAAIAASDRIVPYTLKALPAPTPPPDAGATTQNAPAAGADTEGAATEAEESGDTNLPSVMDVIVDQLVGRGTPAHQVWLPPLAEPPTLDQLLPPLSVDPRHGLCPQGWALRGQLRLPVGLVDKPYLQRRDPMWLDLSGAGGHIGVVGGAQSGKSTAVRSIITALALTHTPEEVQFYCLDFGGGTLSALRDLPHVGAVAGRRDSNLIRRTLAEITALTERREKAFTDRNIDSMATYRRMKRDGQIAGDPYGDVFIVVDGWGLVRSDFQALEQRIISLAAGALSFGIHVIVTAQRWSEIRPILRDNLGSRIELKLGDPFESEIDRKAAVNVPERTPGRGLTKGSLHFLSALPRIDSDPRADTLVSGVADTVDRIAKGWTRPAAPIVRLLPERYPYTDLAAAAQPGAGIPLGIDEETLGPVYLDVTNDAHLVVFGDAQSGKSNLLKIIARGVIEQYTPDKAKLVIIDYRHSLLDISTTPHNLGHAFAATHTPEVVQQIVQGIRKKRLPRADLTPAELRARDWWSGPELFILIDDYDLVVTGSTNPLIPLLDLIPIARDIGLHLILARAMGGAGRAMLEPVIQRLRETGAPGLILSGNKDEGALFGNVKPEPLPPGRGYFTTRRGVRLMQVAAV